MHSTFQKFALSAALAAAFAVTAGPVAHSQVLAAGARPTVRVTEKVDNAVTFRLPGTHPAIVEHSVIGSRLEASTPLTHLRLVLTPSDDQATTLRALLDQQQDKTSPNFHKWLTPDAFGQSFGASSQDIAKITAWLQDQGLKVESVSKSNRIISFAGNAGQVEAAFHTQLNKITVEGEQHISNVTDIAIPAAFSSVVRGVASLNDFHPKSNAVNPHKGEIQLGRAATTDPLSPMYTSSSSGNHYVAPGDAAVIFNSTPLLGAGIDGTGITVAVIGRSDITLSDVQQFRSMFGLKKNDPTFTVIDTDPGVNADDLEAYLDVEWAGGMAPGANVNFIIGGSDYYFSSGINVAGLYAVDNNIGDIITLSYGGCETSNGASGTAFWNTLWEQAASQGQTVFVSSGDSNATGCQSSSATYGTAYGVNAIGSSAYNVAVGGTMFVDFGPSQYWTAPNQSTPFTTATNYIPEAVWNEGTLSTTYLNGASTATQTGSGIVGGGGGISIYTARPSWQTGSGISATADSTCSSGTCIAASSPITGVHRLVPDISFIASGGHDATIFCGEGVCSNTSTGYSIGAIGGTSVATPVMASVQALIDQKNGGRQGNANFYYYPLANADYAAGNCKSINGTAANPTVTLPASTCNFHDVVAGDNRSKQNASDTTGLGFYAGTGYDSGSGLGSVNINNVATNWSAVNFRATTTTFTLSPTVGVVHGTTQLFSATVVPASGTGTPTGDISIIAESISIPSDKLRFSLASGAYSASINGLPAGSYNVHVHYAGDGTFAPSDSASVPVSIAQESSTTTNTLRYLTSGGSIYTGATSLPYGTIEWINTKVTGGSASTNVPSGTLTYGVSLGGTSLAPLVQTLDGLGDASMQAGGGYGSIYLYPDYPALAPGSYVITSSYSGDRTFAASSTTNSFTVVAGTATTAFSTSSTYIASGASVVLNYSAVRPTGSAGAFFSVAAQPTGTVTFTDTTTAVVLGTATLNAAGVASLSTTGVTASGANTISAAYSGDANWATLSSTTTITVGALTSTTTALSVTAGTYYVGSTVPLVATVSPAVAAKVSFYDGATLLGTANASATTGIASLSTTLITAGSHTLNAVFTGTTSYASSAGSTTLAVTPNQTSLIFDAPAASTYGQAISLNGRISRNPSSAAAPNIGLTGTVTFTDGGTTVATATPVFLPGGYGYYTATTTVGTTLTGGSHTLQASYSGDTNYASAVSGSVTLVVARLTPTIVLATTTGSTSYATGSPVFLQAVIPLSSTLAAPTSAVTFTESGTNATYTSTLSYSAAIGGYVATVGLNGLKGTHTYTASITADTNYNTATSNTLTVLVLTNNVWVANGNGTVSGISEAGAAVTGGGVAGGGTAIAIDNSGNIWSLNKSGSAVAEYSNTGTILSLGGTVGGLNAPTALAIDGAGLVWVTNSNSTLSVLSAPSTAVTPASGYKTSSSTPTSLNIDASGNLWITSSGDNTVTEVVGAATPVTTPTSNAVKTNTLAVKP